VVRGVYRFCARGNRVTAMLRRNEILIPIGRRPDGEEPPGAHFEIYAQRAARRHRDFANPLPIRALAGRHAVAD
jgi:hypothetical protein